MTPETEAAAAVLAYSATLSRLNADPRLLLGVGAALGAALWALRPTPSPIRPSVSPRPSPSGGGGTPDGTDGGGGRIHGERAERVSMREEPLPKAWLVPELVPYGPRPRRRLRVGLPPWEWERRGYVTTILGAGGTGKSYVLLDLALAALAGQDWMGRPVQRVAAVLYVDTELDAEECRRRAHPLARGRGLPPVLPRGLHYLHLQSSLASEEGQILVERAAHRVGAGLILVDSLTIGAYDVTASDQNGWNRVYTGMEGWGVPVVAIDHLDKAGRGAFGSFMKQAKVRSCLQLSRLAGSAIKVEHLKSNFGPKVAPFTVAPIFEAPGPGGATTWFTVYAEGAPSAASARVPRSSVEEHPIGNRMAPGFDPQRGLRAGAPAPAPLPLPIQESPPNKSAALVLQERAHRALLPHLAGGEWVPAGRLVRALLDERVCQRTAAYRLLTALAEAGRLERQGEPQLPARAYRMVEGDGQRSTGPAA